MGDGAPGDAFYDEWRRRRPGVRRGLRRAGLLAEALGIAVPGLPMLTVVGSKGKGTAATYASAWLAAAGCRVVTVTSPGLRSDAERIRVDGAAISEDELRRLGGRLRAAARSLPPGEDGYLSPSGLFTMAGLLHARAVGADVAVLEAGMGGASDEVSLFPPSVVAITEVFGEHLGVLGNTPAEIAADKAGVTAATTSAVVTLPQTPAVAAAITATVATRTGLGVETIEHPHVPNLVPAPDRPNTELGDRATTDRAEGDSNRSLDGGGPLPPGLSRANAVLGRAAAQRLLDVTGRPAPGGDRAAAVLSSVRLPGRTSWHEIPGSTLLVDSAVVRAGAAAALAEAYHRWDRIDHVLVCLPDHKDVDGVLAELGGLPVTRVRMPGMENLRFERTPDAIDVAGLTRERLTTLGPRVLVLGTVYFTGRILELIDAETGRLFET
jgi:dihydrofolate synthase/folylpolyglutamate synthase